MTRLCYPTDIPRGARLVEHHLTVAAVAMWSNEDGPIVAVCDDTMRTVLLPPGVQVEIEESGGAQ